MSDYAIVRDPQSGRMRRIAAVWYLPEKDNGYSPLRAFVETGAIIVGLQTELERLVLRCDVDEHSEEAIDELSELYDYVKSHDPRGPVEGWDDVWK